MAFRAISVQLMTKLLSSQSQSEFNEVIEEIRGINGDGAVDSTLEYVKSDPLAKNVKQFIQ